jgi:Family of unknown function (DUF6232)
MQLQFQINQDSTLPLYTELALVVCGVSAMENLKDELITEVELPYEAALRIQRALEEDIRTKVVEVAEQQGVQFTSGPEPTPRPVQTHTQPSVLYEDKFCRVTKSTFEIGAKSYPVRVIASLAGPIQQPMDIGGGLLLNGGLAIVGLLGILSFSPIWMVLGLLAALLGGFNVRGEFRRPWWLRVKFTDGSEEKIVKQDRSSIYNLHAALQAALN